MRETETIKQSTWKFGKICVPVNFIIQELKFFKKENETWFDKT